MKIRQATINDIHSVTLVHRECLPKDEHFTTLMGGGKKDLTSQMYIEYLLEDNLFLVAEDNHHIIGSCMGNMYGSVAMHKFYTKYRGELICRTVMLLLQGHPLAWKKVRDVFKENIRNLSRKLMCFQSKSNQEIILRPDINPPTASLLSICVLDTYRGKCISKLLFEAYEQMLKQRGVKAFTLSTWPDNERAIAFYKKEGMHERIHTDSRVQFIKDIL